METKKNPEADLSRKRTLFFSIGLLVTMSLVLTAFELKQHETPIDEIVQRNTDEFENIEIPLTEIVPPEVPKVLSPIVVEVRDDEKIEDDVKVVIDVSGLTSNPIEPPVVAVIDEPEDNPDEEFLIVESPASPVGGDAAFYKYVGNNIKYPAQARRTNTQGKVFIEFVISKTGAIENARVIKGIGYGCDEEALRVIQNAPAWNPGKQRGKPVRQKMVVPVTFALSN